jgi:hypothetical protein
MRNLLFAFGLAIVTLLGTAAVLGLVLLVAVEVRCLLRVNRQLAASTDEPRFFADVAADLDIRAELERYRVAACRREAGPRLPHL